MTDSGYAGWEWLEGGIGCREISPFGKKVADLLGDLNYGIYHYNFTSLKRVDWKHPSYIEFVWYGRMATVDFDELTRLVILCHDRMIRCSLWGTGPKYMKLAFSERTKREGNIYEACPSVEAHLDKIRAEFPEPKP